MAAEAVRKTQIMLVEDHPLFRRGLAVTLAREPDLEIAAEAATAAQAIELAQTLDVDVAVVDLLMPTRSGLSLTSELHELRPTCKILGLSVIDDPIVIADMLRAGAAGHALKTQPSTEIIDAIRQVSSGIRYLAPSISHDAVNANLNANGSRPLERLTRREREVFELLIRGYSNDEIATNLFISRRTVETHRQRITRKLSAHSIPELQRLAARYGGLTA